MKRKIYWAGYQEAASTGPAFGKSNQWTTVCDTPIKYLKSKKE